MNFVSDLDFCLEKTIGIDSETEARKIETELKSNKY